MSQTLPPTTQTGAPDLSIIAKGEVKVEGISAVNAIPTILQSVLKGSKTGDVCISLNLMELF